MLTWDDYFKRVINLKVEFELAEKALEDWKSDSNLIARHAKQEFEGLREMITQALGDDHERPIPSWFSDESVVVKYLESISSSKVEMATAFKIRLSQNRLVLQVALFEGFLKDLHRAILRSSPNLLRHDRDVPLGKVIAVRKEQIIAEEIEREVQILDRQSTEKKADYFKTRLHIDWFGGTMVPIMDAMIKARNEILHENPDREISRFEGIALEIVTTMLPLNCVAQAAVLYPGSCLLPEHLDEKTVREKLMKEV